METHDSLRDQVTTNQVDQVHIKVRHPETWWTFEPGSSSYVAQSKVSTTTKTTTPTATFNDKGAIESHYSPLRVDPREKVGKSRNTVFFQWFGAPEGRKVGSLKRRVRSQLARWEMKNCTPLWREAHFQVKMYKTRHSRTTFGSWDVQKVHAVVARSTFRSENVQSTPILGPLLEVEMSKKCTPLWREAYFQVKMYKTQSHHSWATFESWDVQKVHAVVARSTFRSENVQSTPFSDHFWKLRCPKSARHCGAKHISKSKCAKH